MEVIFLLMVGFWCLIIWGIARFLGWLFKGPRYRRRKAIQYMRDDVYRTRQLYYDMWYDRRR